MSTWEKYTIQKGTDLDVRRHNHQDRPRWSCVERTKGKGCVDYSCQQSAEAGRKNGQDEAPLVFEKFQPP